MAPEIVLVVEEASAVGTVVVALPVMLVQANLVREKLPEGMSTPHIETRLEGGDVRVGNEGVEGLGTGRTLRQTAQ